MFFCNIIAGNSVIEDLFFFSIPVCPDILKSQIIRLFRQRLWRNFLKLAKVVILIWQTRKSTISLQRDIQLLRCLLRSWFCLFLFHWACFIKTSTILLLWDFLYFFLVIWVHCWRQWLIWWAKSKNIQEAGWSW